ncbi:SPP1 Gp6-like portal protein [Haloactinopolyspora alba]|uniref:SPP1 Gp6-like portal protein n=1 Tax=Haloactinopolyspora alba TaxID=648780 RepID=A0A2P8DHN5_9ACTN|nr:phage portal protein [Haloactinopolyspora alba]PSK96689.1 SPP1 Gp6-like portal protein [Haloactinopolyspora alba]
MAVPSEPLEWVDYLTRRHDAEIGELEQLDRYYDGTQPLTYMHPEVMREVGERIKQVVIGWPQLIVDAIEERLDVEGFRLPDEDEGDDELWRVWQANDMDEQTQIGHVDALTMRRYYVAVGTNENDANTPLVTAESPLEVFADIDPRTRNTRAALRRIHEEDTTARVNEKYATLYLPDETIWYDWAGGWREQDRDQHGLGEVPVIPVVNRARLQANRRDRSGRSVRYGASELAPIIPLSDAANKIATDMMLGSEFVAIPLRGLWGVTPDDLVDEDGNKLTAIQALLGRLLTLADPEGKQFEFPAADLSNFHNTINQLARLVASLAGLPPDYMGLATDNPPSAESRLAGEIRLIKRAERKQRAWGGSYEKVGRLIRKMQTGEELDPRYERLETVWRDASTPTVAQSADAAVKKYQTKPRPVVPLRQTREDLGYTDAQIRRMEAEDEQELQRDPVGVIAQGIAGSDTGGSDGDPGPVD